MSKRFGLLSASIVFFLCCLLGARHASAAEVEPLFRIQLSASAHKVRVIHFPRNYSLGEILIAKYPQQPEESMLRGAARGTVNVPKDQYAIFVPAADFYKNPGIVGQLPADGFDCLRFSASSLADAEDGLCDRALAQIGHFQAVVVLDLDRSDATDAGAAHAIDIPGLQKITAFSSMVEGKCFKQFAYLKQLRIIRMPNTAIRNENLGYLAAIPHLQFLDLAHTGITDVGMPGLAKCNQLVSLDIRENPGITDKSISSLQSLKTLRSLSLCRTSISAAGVLKLKQLPLLRLYLPGSAYTDAQMSLFRKTFPEALIVQNKTNKGALDADTRNLFAPLR